MAPKGGGLSAGPLDAADTVSVFYSALGRGDGATANSLMALEKRASPGHQPDAIEAFYGHMAEPLTLISVEATGPSGFAALQTSQAVDTLR